MLRPQVNRHYRSLAIHVCRTCQVLTEDSDSDLQIILGDPEEGKTRPVVGNGLRLSCEMLVPFQIP